MPMMMGVPPRPSPVGFYPQPLGMPMMGVPPPPLGASGETIKKKSEDAGRKKKKQRITLGAATRPPKLKVESRSSGPK
jgi:hypothetical protein